MRPINDVLCDFIDKDFCNEWGKHYDLNDIKREFKNFISATYLEKRGAASSIVKMIFNLRGKSEAALPFELLKKMEMNNIYYKDYRDHIIHPINVFLLGYFIYKKSTAIRKVLNKKIKDIKDEYYGKTGFLDEESDEGNFIYIWSLISIYHDYGYIFENSEAREKINAFNALVEIDFRCKNNKQKLQKAFINKKVIEYLNSLNINDEDVQALKLIENISFSTNLSSPNNNGLESYLKFCSEYRTLRRPKYLDHGIISSLIFLKLSNIIFLKNKYNTDYNWRENIQDTFFKYIAEAISVHNICVNYYNKKVYQRYDLNLGDKNLFNNEYKIHLERDPFAYLLALSDDLQAWDRKKIAKMHIEQPELTSSDVMVEIKKGIIYFLYYNKDKEPPINGTDILQSYLESVSSYICKNIIIKTGELKMKRKTTEQGYINKNNQKNIGRTNEHGTDHMQWLYLLECQNCNFQYKANGSDIWQRKCPACQGGRP